MITVQMFNDQAFLNLYRQAVQILARMKSHPAGIPLWYYDHSSLCTKMTALGVQLELKKEMKEIWESACVHKPFPFVEVSNGK